MMPGEHSLNFSKLDTKTANLHLIVNTPQIFESLIRRVAGKVA